MNEWRRRRTASERQSAALGKEGRAPSFLSVIGPLCCHFVRQFYSCSRDILVPFVRAFLTCYSFLIISFLLSFPNAALWSSLAWCKEQSWLSFPHTYILTYIHVGYYLYTSAQMDGRTGRKQCGLSSHIHNVCLYFIPPVIIIKYMSKSFTDDHDVRLHEGPLHCCCCCCYISCTSII